MGVERRHRSGDGHPWVTMILIRPMLYLEWVGRGFSCNFHAYALIYIHVCASRHGFTPDTSGSLPQQKTYPSKVREGKNGVTAEDYVYDCVCVTYECALLFNIDTIRCRATLSQSEIGYPERLTPLPTSEQSKRVVVRLRA